ncbi:hypothetical protein [Lyngbya aestuarii]|uniref:hypothetical protein n=1 Tax=Lyngbya aestuarii TaxID=118322 RepID=UPI00403D668B
MPFLPFFVLGATLLFLISGNNSSEKSKEEEKKTAEEELGHAIAKYLSDKGKATEN